MKFIVSLLICFFLALSAAQSIQVDVHSGSNAWWMALAIRNAGVDTRTVQIKQNQASAWEAATLQSGWGYFTYSPSNGRPMSFPISVQLTSVNGNTVTINNIITASSAGSIVSTGVTYGSAATPATAAPPAKAATSAPTVKAATSAPTANAATNAPTARPATAAPTVRAATTAPTARAATAAPTVKAATAAPTSASSTGCSAPMKVMVPLYTYPGASWDTVAASGRVVPTVAIINPNSGPGNGPDATYKSYMTKLNNAGVEMVGYVHTSYGARDINEVKAEINIYASQFPLVVGIFLDEASASAAQLPYYQQLYDYIMSMPGWKYDIINPGATPTAGYLNAATQIVTFEDSSSKFASSSNPSFASCNNKDKFSVITYGASTTSSMQAAVNVARSKGYYGWFYITDRTDICCIYNTITPYYAAMASYIASTN